jgi:hypothetical protein
MSLKEKTMMPGYGAFKQVRQEPGDRIGHMKVPG